MSIRAIGDRQETRVRVEEARVRVEGTRFRVEEILETLGADYPLRLMLQHDKMSFRYDLVAH